MIARGFKPVAWVAAVGGAALSCYMLSLNVAAERADLARVEREIVMAKREIRGLQTELGTRGRLQQLEHWNADVLALSAPASGQFLQDEFRLASYSQPEKTFQERAKVQMASAETGSERPKVNSAVARGFDTAPDDLNKPVLRRASLIVGEATPFAPPINASAVKPVPKAAPAKVIKTAAKVAAPKPAAAKPVKVAAKSGLLDGSLAREIVEASKAEKNAGDAAAR